MIEMIRELFLDPGSRTQVAYTWDLQLVKTVCLEIISCRLVDWDAWPTWLLRVIDSWMVVLLV